MQRFEIADEPLPGIYILNAPCHSDTRGNFVKLFHSDQFDILFPRKKFKVAEHFYSRSSKDVLRGMHYQSGNAAHAKLICCTAGEVLDVVVDIRKESPYFNKPFSIKLSSRVSQAIIVGKGYAHGFLALTDNSVMHYMTTAVHSPENDCGILWSSIDFEWPVANPILSDRDQYHPQISSL